MKSSHREPETTIPDSGKCDRNRVWRAILCKIGKRYESCRLATFDVGRKADPFHDVRHDVRSALTDLDISEHVERGRGVFLYGPPGTGKDHLAIGLLHRAVAVGYSGDWLDAASFAATMRDRMDTGGSERDAIRRLVEPDVLVVSDICPQGGAATPYQLSVLFQIIDGRYRRQRSTIVTANVSSGSEAGDRLSPAIVDRLRDDSLTLFCNWPSHRAAL